MSVRRVQFSKDKIYHITLRRVGDRLLFKDVNDYYRGIFSIYEFNNSKSVEIRKRRAERARWKVKNSGGLASAQLAGTIEVDKRDRLVDVLSFCFMPNHIHLLLREIREGGISKFMQKFGTGFARYSMDKYHYRMKGHFFQDKFMAVHIKDDRQLKVVFAYIHTNPIAIIEPPWKENGILNIERARKFLEGYKWSSYQDYLGIKNFPSVIERDFLSKIFGGEDGCKEIVNSWVEYKGLLYE